MMIIIMIVSLDSRPSTLDPKPVTACNVALQGLRSAPGPEGRKIYALGFKM